MRNYHDEQPKAVDLGKEAATLDKNILDALMRNSGNGPGAAAKALERASARST